MNDPKFTPWVRGESITARKLNQAGEAAAAAAFQQTTRAGGPAPNSVPFPVTVVTVFDDYLTCRPLNIEGADNDIYVAKPWNLRKTPFDTLTMPNQDGTLMSFAYSTVSTQARTVTDTTDDSTEDQVIVPAYVPKQTISEIVYPGSQITVQRVALGPGVSFTGSGNIEVEVEFEDMNRAGRAWAEDNGS